MFFCINKHVTQGLVPDIFLCLLPVRQDTLLDVHLLSERSREGTVCVAAESRKDLN